MSQIRQLWIQCSIQGHDQVQLACVNQQCKANRLYCHQCLKNGDHITHMKDQKNLNELIEFFHQIKEESECLIQEILLMVEKINGLFAQLNQELKKKYQFSKVELLRLNANQLNQVLGQVIKYDEIKTVLLEEVKKCTDYLIIQLQRNITELKLEESTNSQINKKEHEKVEEFYQKGYKLYQEEGKYEEAIKSIDAGLIINSNHINSLYLKAECLKMLYKYNDAIKCTDKILSIDSKHVNSLSIKAHCLKMLGDYINAITWAEKALSIDLNNLSSLCTKGESLRILGKYNEAINILDQALNCNPQLYSTLASKGACLQSLSKYSEAIFYFNQAIQINRKYSWAKNKKAECETLLKLRMQLK